ncbi:MAG: response regulator [Rhizomicrobium sp.]
MPATHRLDGLRFAIVTRNALLREALVAQIRALGGEIGAFVQEDEADQKIDYVFVDAGTGAVPDPRALPDREIPSFVLLPPAAHGKLENLMEKGFAGHLAKPIRQDRLIETFSASAQLEVRPDDFLFAERASEVSVPAMRPTRSFKVLLAEDNPINALLTRELLRRRGHTVREVTTGEAAVKAMDEERFDLMLTDIHMPAWTGSKPPKRSAPMRRLRAGRGRRLSRSQPTPWRRASGLAKTRVWMVF